MFDESTDKPRTHTARRTVHRAGNGR